jgi:predicted O-linked N-acetylglucosamine transferase (SPINDLY family)
LLTAVGMPELITESMEEYVSRAIALARQPQALSALKDKLARNRLIQPLFDTERFRKDIEEAYTGMWQAWRRGESPKSFSVEPAREDAAGH